MYQIKVMKIYRLNLCQIESMAKVSRKYWRYYTLIASVTR